MSDAMFRGIPDPEPALEPKKSLWVGAAVIALMTAVITGMTLVVPKSVPWAVSGGVLQVHTRLEDDDFPLKDLRPELALVIDLNTDGGWRPVHKFWGVNGFGLNAGRFELVNGRKADIYLTNETTVVLIPRRGDVPVIVGVHDPQPLLDALKNARK